METLMNGVFWKTWDQSVTGWRGKPEKERQIVRQRQRVRQELKVVLYSLVVHFASFCSGFDARLSSCDIFTSSYLPAVAVYVYHQLIYHNITTSSLGAFLDLHQSKINPKVPPIYNDFSFYNLKFFRSF